MKKIFIIIFTLLTLSPFLVSAQVTGICNSLQLQGGQSSGGTKEDCDNVAGTFYPDDPNAVPIDTGNPSPNPDKGTTPATDNGVINGLVPCNTSKNPGTCDIKSFMTLINTVIQFILFKMVVPIAAIMFAYAGFLMVTSGGSVETWSKAKSIFGNVALGLIIAIAAYLIIRTILSILGFTGSWIGF
ncbi:hypothetical protein K2P96_00535 [Patescibacteria group bacterium]|nr:hypothetical protein [Patescibacteria group bacterium]